MVNTLYQEKSGAFQKKNAMLTIHAYVDNRGSKKIGSVAINLSDCVNATKDKESVSIAECSDKKAKICISVRGYSLGESVGDNMSETSEKSVQSLGTEGDFSGSIFHEQEAHEGEEESKTKIGSKKPPIFRKASDSGKAEGEESARFIDIKAAHSLLEKENQQLRTEKDDIKIQLEIISEKARKEREMFCEHANKLDAEIDGFRQQNNLLQRKLVRRREKAREMKKNWEELSEECENLKMNHNISDKVKLLDEIKRQKAIAIESKETTEKLMAEIEEIQNLREISENSREQLESLNLKYIADISNLKRKISDQQEVLLAKTPDDQASYKKKVDTIISDLKKELAEVQNERDEASAKRTELVMEIQKLRSKYIASENSMKTTIRNLNYTLENRNDEINSLNERLDEEMKNSKHFERKTLIEKEEIDGKLLTLNKNIKELATEKDSIEKNLLEHQRKQIRNRSETEPNSLESLQKNLALYQAEIQRLKRSLAQKESENQEFADKIFQLEHAEEIYNIGNAGVGNSFTQEQVITLKGKISHRDNEMLSLIEKNKLLGKELELTIEKQKETQKSYENQMASLRIQIITLQGRDGKEPKDTKEFVSSMQEESYKQTIEMNKLEIKELKNLIVKVQDDLKAMEKKYMDAKVSVANLDLQKDNIFVKYREIQETLKESSKNYTTMEVEFYKINERFGQTLNQNNLLENEIQNLKGQIYELNNRKRR